ncbi:Protein LURP-one-related 15 [Orchesella cincta]|uniref:Protein LURP-one-related 15 n=1 Tax=Orchesella cincta TaxID=48709 RepID=A0A1D2NMQ5_ORCCI|nr:Protein LURP-one-related 15 [Orchesella cincta]
MEPMDLGGSSGAHSSNQDVRNGPEEAGSKDNLLQNEYILRQLPEMICGTVQRHCTPYATTLHIRKRFFTRKVHSDIFTMKSEKCLYKCVTSADGVRDIRTIMELATGLPALNFKTNKFRFSNRFSLRLGDSYHQIGRCVVLQTLLKTKFIFDFVDVLSMDKRRIFIKIRQWSRSVLLYLGDPKEGGIPIAHLYPPGTASLRWGSFPNYGYDVDIAPGVDVALVIGLILVADDYVNVLS